MRIKSLKIQNFRTIESLNLDLSANYTALCGPNDSGKTNIIRAIRSLLGEKDESNPFVESVNVSFKDDYPKWKTPSETDQAMSVSAEIEIDSSRDAGLYQSTIKQLSIEDPPTTLVVMLSTSYHPERTTGTVIVEVDNKQVDGVSAQEVLNRIRSAKAIAYHNSTAPLPRWMTRESVSLGDLRDLSPENEQLLSRIKADANSLLTEVAKGRQQEFESLLAKLERRYKVGLSIPTFDFAHLPFSITLGEPEYQMRLDEWGSGTRNRTQILLALFTSKKISESEATASKTTPLIILEEPECFLHPSAQAEFGRIVRDLANDFNIQVLVTTHSPYMLSLTNTDSNVLLQRCKLDSTFRGTERVNTFGENWMQPFADALGLSSQEFLPWRNLFSANGDAVLLVEGESDKEYFEMLRDHRHGENRLNFVGDIIPYGGADAINNPTLLRFVKARYSRAFVTYDLDADSKISKSLENAGFQRGRSFLSIGKDLPGRRNIEGLLPDCVKSTVRERSAELVDAATQATGEEQKSARNRLKASYLEEFKSQYTPTQQFFGEFYPLVQVINSLLSTANYTSGESC